MSKSEEGCCGGKGNCEGSCSCKDDEKGKEKTIDFITLTDELDKELQAKGSIEGLPAIFSRHGATVDHILEVSNKLDRLMSFLFGNNDVVFSCYEEAWSINHEGFIQIADIAEDGQSLTFIVTSYVGCIHEQLIFQGNVCAPGLPFHELKGGLIVSKNKFTEEFDEKTVIDKLFLVENMDTLAEILNSDKFVKGCKYCEICGSEATAHTEKGWFCSTCSVVLRH